MILSRAASIFLRANQFICAAIVLGLSAYFVQRRLRHSRYPFGRIIYTLIVSCISMIASLIWIIPTTSSIISYASDFVFSGAWFAAFGVLYRWHHNGQCGTGYNTRGYRCGPWKAMMAFSFLSGVFWLASGLLGLLAVHRLQKKRGADVG